MNKACGKRDIELESFLRWPFFLYFIFNTILAQTAIQRGFPSKWSKRSFFILKYSWFTMLCSFLLYSKVIQFYILFHYGLSQDIEYSSLYSRTLFFIYSMYNGLYLLISNSQSILPLLPLKKGNHKSVLCLRVCFGL